ncbi:MAG: 30S ribosomal protein S9 [Dehalococcoidales bacterium]|nr:30S ribosomal protein S9 [Dehalococcoidales bacterium]
MKKKTYSQGTGRRKTAVAQVRIMPGSGEILINGMPYEQRFTSFEHRKSIVQPFMVTETMGKFDVSVIVDGGGVSGQAGAISMGISRALLKEDEKFKAALRGDGLLTRDSRAKERKKPGLKRARKAPQYTKR